MEFGISYKDRPTAVCGLFYCSFLCFKVGDLGFFVLFYDWLDLSSGRDGLCLCLGRFLALAPAIILDYYCSFLNIRIPPVPTAGQLVAYDYTAAELLS